MSESRSSTNQVLLLYELAETVLLYLPLTDLLLANRVCKAWQNVIRSSSKINKVLFRQPIDDRRISYPHETFKLSQSMSQPGWRTKDTPDTDLAYPILNPFVSQDIQNDSYTGSSIQEFLVSVCESNSPRGRCLASGATWENMLLIQPPAKKLFYQCRLSRMWSPNLILGTFSAESIWPEGNQSIDLNMVAESVRAHMAKCPECPAELTRIHTVFHGIRRTTAVRPRSTSGWEMLALLEHRT